MRRKRSCPLYPQKRTCSLQLGMSAFGPGADKLGNRLLGVLSGRLDARTVDDRLRIQSFRHGTEGATPVAI
jgi:hypothetical protein